MTPAERVMAALAGQPSGPPPLALVLGLYGARLTGLTVPLLYREPEAWVQGQRAVLQAFSPDVLYAPFALARLGEAFGAPVRWFTDQPPNLTGPACPPGGLLGRDLPDPESHPALLYVREALRGLVEACADAVPVAAIGVLPHDLLALVLGLDAWMRTFLSDPPLADALVAAVTPWCLRWNRLLLADGAGCVVLPLAFGGPAVLPLAVLERRVLPCLAGFLPAISGAVVLHHGGGRLLPALHLVNDLPGLVGIALEEDADAGRVPASLGRDRGLFTGLDGRALAELPEPRIAAAVAGLRARWADRPRLLVITTGADVPLHTPPDAIATYCRAWRDG